VMPEGYKATLLKPPNSLPPAHSFHVSTSGLVVRESHLALNLDPGNVRHTLALSSNSTVLSASRIQQARPVSIYHHSQLERILGSTTVILIASPGRAVHERNCLVLHSGLSIAAQRTRNLCRRRLTFLEPLMISTSVPGGDPRRSYIALDPHCWRASDCLFFSRKASTDT
jgi:hypothetical protein